MIKPTMITQKTGRNKTKCQKTEMHPVDKIDVA